jgi:hypothetical protein
MTNAELMTNDKWRISGRLYPVIFSSSWDFTLKNYRPPHPIGVKGGCSPQNILKNFEATKRASNRSQQILSEKFVGLQAIKMANESES